MLRTMTQGYPRFHPYKRVLYHNVDGSSPELKDYHVVAADHGRFLEEIAQLPPLSEQSQPLRLEQHHGQQQKQPEDHGDTASANVGCEHELVVCGQGRVKRSKEYLFVVFMVIVILVVSRFCSCWVQCRTA